MWTHLSQTLQQLVLVHPLGLLAGVMAADGTPQDLVQEQTTWHWTPLLHAVVPVQPRHCMLCLAEYTKHNYLIMTFFFV